MITVGSKWLGNDRNLFTVTAVVSDGVNAWVHYTGPAGQVYSCYLAAFRARFRYEAA